jgi:hypothetical protein
MLKTSIILQDARTGRASALMNELSELAGSAHFRRLRVAVAYATKSGCKDLVKCFEKQCRGWNTLQKQWLISIDFGRTEAEALQLLNELGHSEIRIPNAEELLARRLKPKQCFHPKTFILDSGVEAANAPFGLFLGSGNLTLSGLNSGVEHGTSLLWRAPLSASQFGLLTKCHSELSWWDEAWNSATPVTDHLIAQYRSIRPVQPKEDTTPSVLPFVSPSRREIDTRPGLAWANAKCFWIRTNELYKNRGRGNPGNQLDLKRGTRVYFGFSPDTVQRNTVLGSVILQYDAMHPRSCSVRFADNSMDKINLPIPGQDGPGDYDNAVVHFERLRRRRFRVTLGNQIDQVTWRRKSQKQGTLHTFTGGREFGFYS